MGIGREAKGLAAALLFLTRLPIPGLARVAGDFGSGMTYFPVVGFVLGSLLAAADLLFTAAFPPAVAAALVLLVWVSVTGGLHLDGWMDTMDGLFSAREREQMLIIMKDSRVGAHGVAAAVILLLLKWTLLFSLPVTEAWPVLPVTVTLSRWVLVPAMVLYPYARDQGLGTYFRQHGGPAQTVVAGVLALAIAAGTAGTTGLILFAGAVIWALAFNAWVKGYLGGLTGDTYGALAETEEVVLLLLASLLAKIPGW